jgi:hypothetical protein
MRAHEFLTESRSSLLEGEMTNAQWMKPKYVDNLELGLKEKQPFTFNVASSQGNITTGIIQNPEQLMKAMRIATKNKTLAQAKIKVSITVVDKETWKPTGEIVNNVPINMMFKDEKILRFLNPNMGNVSEALLGCAVAAKFMSNGKPVTEVEAINVGRQLIGSKGELQATAGKDKLFFKVSIPKMDNKAFKSWLGMDSKTLKDYNVPEKTIALFDRRLKAAIDYANTSKRVMSAIQEAQEDPRNNKVDVISDGGEKENQNTTKVDLKILIDGQETAKRLLSVKAGDVAQFGQVVGANFEHVTEFFSSFNVPLSPAIKKYFYEIAKGSRDTSAEKQHNFDNGMLAAYEDAGKKLKAKARTDQAGLVEDVYQGLLQHLTRKEEGVEMVILDPDDKKAFRELSFGPEFEKAMRQLQLVVVENMEGKAHIISIYGYPIGSIAKKFVPTKGTSSAANKLVDLKSQFKDGTVRNMTAMGGLLKDISDIANYIEQIEDQPQQQKQPAAKTPVPVQGVKPAGVKPVVKTPTTKPLPTVGQPMGKQPVGQQPTGQQPVYTNQ